MGEAAIDSNSNGHILVVEDTEIQAKKLIFFLNKYGFTTEWAVDGQAGLDALRSTRFDLVMTDVQMPILDGLKMLGQIKADENLSRIPIVVLTTLEDDEVCLSALRLGASDFLQKPFVPEEVELRAHNLIKLHKYERLLLSENMQLADKLVEKNRILESNFKELEATHEKLKEMQTQLVQTSKMASLGTLSAGIAHEINNPLTIIKGYNEQIMRDIDKSGSELQSVNQLTSRIDNAIQRIHKIVKHLRKFSGEDKTAMELSRIDLAEVLVGLQDFFGEQIRKAGIELTFDLCDQFIKGENVLIEHTFMNLIHNSIDVLSDCDEKKIHVKSWLEGDKVVVSLSDSGPGVSEENQPRLFDPFFTTKDPGKGVGLGLSLVTTYVKECQAEIEYKPIENGACFILKYNCAEEV